MSFFFVWVLVCADIRTNPSILWPSSVPNCFKVTSRGFINRIIYWPASKCRVRRRRYFHPRGHNMRKVLRRLNKIRSVFSIYFFPLVIVWIYNNILGMKHICKYETKYKYTYMGHWERYIIEMHGVGNFKKSTSGSNVNTTMIVDCKLEHGKGEGISERWRQKI